MLLARWIVRCVVLTVAALVLTGCPSITRQVELPPSVDRAQELARQGDQPGAAKVYEALAEQNSGAERFGRVSHQMEPERPRAGSAIENESRAGIRDHLNA